MQEIARFLAAHPPFDGLPPEALAQTAAPVSCGTAATPAATCT
jgi:hypothetical protein